MSIPITDVRDISRIAYGFMGSKALFAALNLDLFSHLAAKSKPLDDLVRDTGVPLNRLRTILAALTGIGLLAKDGELYRNAPASQRYLVRGAPAYFGDYYRFQIDRQVYPAMTHIDAGIAGDKDKLAFDSLSGLLSNETEADAFTRAQHAGSLGPALMLTKSLDLGASRMLLDVGGGSGAFSIAFCQRFPELKTTLVDFPNVVAVAKRFVSEARLVDRVSYLTGDAVEVVWPQGQDVVLMSYLMSAVAESAFPVLFKKAWQALNPGGILLVHDFMLDDDETGPGLAALWFFQYLASRIDGRSFSAMTLSQMLVGLGFTEASSQVMIPEITKIVICRKPL
jgi:2-hydroxy-4-(methylsulfanyl)butanoate S-methyltransferase